MKLSIFQLGPIHYSIIGVFAENILTEQRTVQAMINLQAGLGSHWSKRQKHSWFSRERVNSKMTYM